MDWEFGVTGEGEMLGVEREDLKGEADF